MAPRASSNPSAPPLPLHEAKQQLVRDVISEAAIELFVTNGFEQTTVDDIAKAAGVSRRSFFRYFTSKNDLMGQTITTYGTALSRAIVAAPRTYSAIEVVRDVVLRISAAAAAYPRTRQIIQVSRASAAARQAQLSRMGDVENQIAEAFASRRQSAFAAAATPRLLASLTLSILDVTFQVWFDEQSKEIAEVAEHLIASLTHLFGGETARPRAARNSQGALRQTPGH